MAYYDRLKTKWADLSGTTQEKIAAINTLTVPGPDKLVAIADIMTYLRTYNLWLPIKAAAGTNPAAAAVVDIEEDLRANTIDFSLPIVSQLLAALVQTNLLSQNHADEITAMKATTQLWWQANGYPSIFNENDLIAAGDLT